jgi:hypothetical protein
MRVARDYFIWRFYSRSFLDWETFQALVLEKIKTHILCSNSLFRKWCCLRDIVEKYGRARQATDNDIIRRMRFVLWMGNATNTHSEFVIFTAYCTAKMVARTRLNVRLYVLCLSCFIWIFHKAAYHRRMVDLPVAVGVPQFENPWSTGFKNLEILNDVNMISWPNTLSSMYCGNNSKSVSKRPSVLIKVSYWLSECNSWTVSWEEIIIYTFSIAQGPSFWSSWEVTR